jgi:DNA-directed RNA polymerase subunit RPC12/RpoP
MRTQMGRVARRVGVPGLLTWVMFIGTYLWVRVPLHNWHWWDIAKYTAMVLAVSFVVGSLREHELPYIVCTSCGKKNHDDQKAADLTGWRCWYCKQPTIVRVGKRLVEKEQGDR